MDNNGSGSGGRQALSCRAMGDRGWWVRAPCERRSSILCSKSWACMCTAPTKSAAIAGELAGLAPIGVKATGSMDDVLALKPDCVLYMPHICSFDEICQILEAGINIVSTRMELQNPVALDIGIARRLEEACQRGGSSVPCDWQQPGLHHRGASYGARLDPAPL